MACSYAEVYALFCQSTIETLQARLSRAVSAQEQRCIWNAGSLMMLESVERTLQEGSLAAVEDTLRTMPQRLGRPATEAEHRALEQMEHIRVLVSLEKHLTSAAPDQRETALHEALAPVQ